MGLFLRWLFWSEVPVLLTIIVEVDGTSCHHQSQNEAAEAPSHSGPKLNKKFCTWYKFPQFGIKFAEFKSENVGTVFWRILIRILTRAFQWIQIGNRIWKSNTDDKIFEILKK